MKINDHGLKTSMSDYDYHQGDYNYFKSKFQTHMANINNRYLIAVSKSSNPKGKTAEEGSEDGESKIIVWVISR